MYDIMIKNGTVIDHSQREISVKRDIYIKDGLIVNIDHDPKRSNAKKIIDASGCFIVPGLIDSHFHAYEGGNSVGAIYPDVVCPPSGVTTVIDAGTSGPLNFKAFYSDAIVRSKTQVKALLHPSALGVLWPLLEEPEDPDQFDTRHILELFDAYPNVLVGLKIRCHKNATTKHGSKPIEKAVEIANIIEREGHKCSVTMHFGELSENVSLKEILECLRPGDTFSHFYEPCNTPIYNQSGEIERSIWEARKRGVLFDAAMATSHFSLKNIHIIHKENFFPDIISTDMVSANAYIEPCFSLPYCMSLFLNEGMAFEDVIKSVTYTPAKAFGILGDAGTLKERTRANIAVISKKEDHRIFRDRHEGTSTWNEVIVPVATIRNGQVVYQQISY